MFQYLLTPDLPGAVAKRFVFFRQIGVKYQNNTSEQSNA